MVDRMTSIFFDYGGANQVELTEGVATVAITSRNSFLNKCAGDNSVWENIGIADRTWNIKGGPISVDDLVKLKTLADSTAQVHFRAPITGDIDVHILILSIEAALSTMGLPSAAMTTKCMYINANLREAI